MRIVGKISVRDHQIFQITQLEFSSFRISFDDSLCDICNEIAIDSVFHHVARTYANLIEQKEVFT